MTEPRPPKGRDRPIPLDALDLDHMTSGEQRSGGPWPSLWKPVDEHVREDATEVRADEDHDPEGS